MLISGNITAQLKTVLKSKSETIRMQGCELILVMAKRGYVSSLYEGKLFPLLLQLLTTDEYLRWKIARCIRIITEGASPQIIT